MSQTLYAPWRMDYIQSIDKPADGCFLCAAAATETAAQRRDALVLWTTPHTLVLMNRYPYANGHVLVAPRAHKADLEELDDAESLDLQKQTTRVVRILRKAVSAQGFNIGINVGRVAGAGVPGHLHQHIVPRWGGDVNYMSVIAEMKVIPAALSVIYDQLLAVKEAEDAGSVAP